MKQFNTIKMAKFERKTTMLAVLLRAAEMKKTDQVQIKLQLVTVTNSLWTSKDMICYITIMFATNQNLDLYSVGLTTQNLFPRGTVTVTSQTLASNLVPWQRLHSQSQANKINVCRLTCQCLSGCKLWRKKADKKKIMFYIRAINIHVRCIFF